MMPLVRRASSKAARSFYQLDYAEKEVEIYLEVVIMYNMYGSEQHGGR